MSRRNRSLATLAAQAGHYLDPANGALVAPVQPSTTFARGPDYVLTEPGRSYARADNPSFDQAEALLAAMECGEQALLFASGMAAATAYFASFDRGDRVVVQSRGYYGVIVLARGLPERAGVDVSFWPPGTPDTLDPLLDGAAGVWLETPANPTWDVVDIAAICERAHARGACVAVDSTCATPVLTRPLELGADYVMHSATKYLNGHSDLVAGAIVGRAGDERFERIRAYRADAGAVLGSFEAWLLLRGMRTLVPRVRTSSNSALAIARFLETHPAVERVLYPGLPSSPGHELAARQMRGGFGGMLSLLVKGGREEALAVAGALELFVRATSLGGVESLVEHRETIERGRTEVAPNLLRLSVGIEDAQDLVEDLRQALDRVVRP